MTVIDRPARSIEAGVTHDLYRDVHKGIRSELFGLTSEAGRLDPTPFATHRFALADAEEAYDVFGAAAESHALKVVLEAAPVARELVERHEVPVTA